MSIALLAAISALTAPASTSSWTGWLYLEGLGDLPVRIRLSEDGTGEIDLPVLNQYSLPLSGVEVGPASLRFQRVSDDGSVRSFTSGVGGDVRTGSVDWNGTPGRFDLIRSSVPISGQGVDAGAEGYYLFSRAIGAADDGVWQIVRRPYGETVVRDLLSGEQRAILLSSGDYVLGGTLYDLGQVQARFTINDSGLRVAAASGPFRPGEADRIVLERREVIVDAPGGPLRVVITRRDRAVSDVAIVVVGGSAWETAETVSFQADTLAALGVTVYAFDNRGFGGSPGDREGAFADLALDVAAVADQARQDLGFAARIGGLALSRGGWILPQTPEVNRRFDFLVLGVSPAVSPARQETWRRLRALAGSGADRATLATAERYFDAMWRFGITGEGWTEYANLQAWAVEVLPEDLRGPQGADDAEWEWARQNGAYDPTMALSALRMPVLAIFGELDEQVDPAVNAPLMLDTDQTDGVPNFDVVVIPGADHSMAVRPADQPLYAFSSMGGEGMDVIYRWLTERGVLQ